MLFDLVAPLLDRAQRTRATTVHYEPEEADPLDQRSRIVAPLVARREVIGYLYADLDGAFGRFRDADRDLMSMLAGQAAVALDNAQRAHDLEATVAKRTEELRVSNAELAQRADELAIINGIQQGMASALDFQAIIDLVGDKLREVFHTDNIGIRWVDEQAGVYRYLYEYEHGVRLEIPASPITDTPVRRELRAGRSVVVNRPADQVALEIKTVPGTDTSRSAVFVPIMAADRLLGSIMLENYEREYAFDAAAVRLLHTIASSMAVALENARLFAETQRLFKEAEQRNAELAVINSVQQGVGAALDFQAIVDIVGDKLREVFQTDNIGIRWTDEAAGVHRYLYEYEHGVRLQLPPTPIEENRVRARMKSGECVVLQTPAEMEGFGLKPIPGTDTGKSVAFVPIMSGERLLGSIVLEDYQREYAFGEADVRLLQTIAASMGVALENARLFAETQRLFKEAEQRNAELAVINSIQQGVGAALDFQAIVDVVGDKLREVFHTGDMSIRWWETATNDVHMLYSYEHGARLPPLVSPLEPDTPRWRLYHGDRKPVVIGTVEEQLARGIKVRDGTDRARSMLVVPMVAADRILGSIHLENHERDHAFGPAHVRLLETIASSMGVALLNAKSFEAERQRAAELAIISSVQRALAGELSMQGVYDAVGDKIREVFGGALLVIRMYDARRGHRAFSLRARRHRPARGSTEPGRRRGFGAHVLRTRETLVVDENLAARVEEFGSSLLVDGQPMPKTQVMVPAHRRRAGARHPAVNDVEREHAFSPSDIRLLETLASSMSVALENARLFGETQRLLKETEQRHAELAVINSIQQGIASNLDFQAIVDLVGDKLREVFQTGDIGISWWDAPAGMVRPLYVFEHGVRIDPRGFPDPARWRFRPTPAEARSARCGQRSGDGGAGLRARGRHRREQVVRRRPGDRRRPRDRLGSSSRTTSVITPSANPTSACSPPLPPARASRSRTRGSSRRRSAARAKPPRLRTSGATSRRRSTSPP